ncbi:ATP-dependent helicase HrpB, partial [Oleiagrimonas sp.]|uniref:ATP-dependent helicase HrpB n=1 Tax=Oleiagrimonas sp. TaxID=2010330 RepID=UPI002638AFDE
MKFPISPLLPQILEALQTGTRLVLEAPPGAGKTTQVPPALLDAPWLQGRRILVLEPRRIAARAAAEFMAMQRGEAVGETVGYRMRFESRVSGKTRIEVITEGLLARRIQDDPELSDVGVIVFDEFHERHLAGDLGVVLALDVQASLRPDLRLLVMSATLDGERIAQWLEAPRLSSPGRSCPVKVQHPPERPQESPMQHLVRSVKLVMAELVEGDVLVFLPGRREISLASRLLQQALAGDVQVLVLHGELALADQHAVLSPDADGHRRVILATNVAESSLTLPGIRVVVDSGQARVPRFDPNSGFTRLETVTISQASADQRAGRAGRVAPGMALRLWPQSMRMEPSRAAEITQAELSGLALELAAWGNDDLRWLDPPPSGALAQARELLRQLGALDAEGRPTALGRDMHALGAPPRLGAAVARAAPAQHALMADLLALLDARSPLRGNAGRSDDFRSRLAALHAWRDGGAQAARRFGADVGALSVIERAARGWRQRLGVRGGASGTPHSHAVGDLLAHAFPDRLARQVPGQPLRYQLSNGRGARLHEQTALQGEPWLVALDLRLETRDSLILAAAPFDPDLLERDYPERFHSVRNVRWNEERDAVEAFEEQRFDALVLSRRSVPVRPKDAVPALLSRVRERGLDALPWNASTRRLRGRVQALSAWMPELGLPDLSDKALLETLEIWLGPFLAGKRRLGALAADELAQALLAPLDHAQRQQLDIQAPEKLTVPSGMQRALEYMPDAPPVLAVKLQELFGLADTPRVAGGRVPVTLHLLSPAGRPIQVTQDLAGFWERTYPEVKKELKGRYPKHPWPDDPWSATPTHRAKRRG